MPNTTAHPTSPAVEIAGFTDSSPDDVASSVGPDSGLASMPKLLSSTPHTESLTDHRDVCGADQIGWLRRPAKPRPPGASPADSDPGQGPRALAGRFPSAIGAEALRVGGASAAFDASQEQQPHCIPLTGGAAWMMCSPTAHPPIRVPGRGGVPPVSNP